jgi:hypothetical protein
VVTVEQVHVALLPYLDHEVPVSLGPEVLRGERDGCTGADVGVPLVEVLGVVGREEVGGPERAVGLHREAHDGRAERVGR